MRVAVVGAGLAGIAAARELVAGGHEVVVFEKSRGLGGRLASRRAEGTVLDHGSPFIAALAGTALRALIDAIPADDRTDLDEGVVYAAGATRLPKMLAAGLDVRLGVRLAALRGAGERLELGDEQGNTHGAADAVVVTAPAPQAADLLARSPEPESRVAALRGLSYAPAVMVLVGAVVGADADWVVRHPGGPLAEVRREAVKGRPPSDGVEPLVLRLDAASSARLLDASDDEALALALPALAAVLGDGAAAPAWAQVKRWRYAVPEGRLDEEAVNPPGTRIVVAGDTVTGAAFGGPDHHRVFDSGVRAARRVASIPTTEAVR